MTVCFVTVQQSQTRRKGEGCENAVLLPSVHIQERCQVFGSCLCRLLLQRRCTVYCIFQQALWNLLACIFVLFAHFCPVEVKVIPSKLKIGRHQFCGSQRKITISKNLKIWPITCDIVTAEGCLMLSTNSSVQTF